MTDQHRADYLGCAGHPTLRTPHIDSIAASGTRFDRFYVASPVCMPNRASLLTGRYPSAHGLRYNGNFLSWRANTFVDVLRAGGYRTAHIGKSHVQPMTNAPPYPRVDPKALGPIDEAWKDDGGDYAQEEPDRFHHNTPADFKRPYYGYDHIDMVTKHGDQCDGHYYQWLKKKQADADALRDRKNQLPHDYVCPQAYRTPIPEELYPTSFVRERAIEFLSGVKDDNRPFFAFVSFPDPHHPFTPPGKYWDMYDPADFSVGRPYEAHKNPPPPLVWSRERMRDGGRTTQQAEESFMANEREIREAMALTCGMISMIDDAIGDIIEALKASGRYDDTVLIFNADHGDYLGDYGMMLKGALAMDAINRVPFIWSDPADRKPRASTALASAIDLAPSIIARAGLKPYWGLQGRDLWDTETPERPALLIEFNDSKKRQGFPEPVTVRTLITDDFRFSIYSGVAWGELYDTRNDPDEAYNLWDSPSHAALRAELTEQLTRQMMAMMETSPRSRRSA
jgi:arylsulfatase A-like enzyme